jgi:uncharacterized protein (DUF1800 family)
MPSLPDLQMLEKDALADEQTSAPSRRRFLTIGASAAAAIAGAATVEAQVSRSGKNLGMPAPSTKLDPSTDWKDPVLRLVRRISMGLSPAEVALARQLGYAGYLEYQLNAAAIDDSAVDAFVATNYPFVGQTSAQLKSVDSGEAYNQLSDAAVYRAAFSKRQLKERMVEFWTDHFNILWDKVSYLKITDDRDVIRANALGKFPDMLRASAQSAAMLGYLDQSSSRKPTPNQNYAREIMELHTLGVDGGYTQTDVAQLSRILTGFSYDSNGNFLYQKNFHDFTAKTFLNTAFPAMTASATAAQMKAEADTAITMLVTSPATAKYIATKMTRWLLAHEPPASVVDATTATYLATGGDIKAMIRTILTGKNLMAAPAKYKRPFHLVASSLRALNAEVTNIRSTQQKLDNLLDMTPFYHEQPDGYNDKVGWWSGLAIERWNWATYISTQNSATNTRINTTTNFRAPLDTADGVVNQINLRVFGGEAPALLKTQLATYLKGGTYNDTRIRETLALALSSHQFQWY